MQNLLLVIHLIIAVVLIGAILLQRSEGGALGIGGSGGGGGNLFSARGVGNGLTRLTAILAVCFFITSIALTVLATRTTGGSGAVFGDAPPTQDGNAPVPAPAGEAVLPNLGQQQAPAPAAPAAPANN
jgi:preprotein translocase subunit SecG